ncbi:MAG: protein kinase [Deltaproteobacteria bacterium]|nr:protein kinase [Deltaproteobacteria bacterium]
MSGTSKAEAAPLAPGTVIADRYQILRPIGRGGYGWVFEARHSGTGQTVALKVLRQNFDPDDLAVRRFVQEAQVTAGLRHPHTVRVFDVGQDDAGVLYLAMEMLEGHSLRREQKKRLAEGRSFSEAEVVEISIAVTRSLSEAHAAGLVHRDLKPDNVFLHKVEGDERLTVKVLDFGIAKLPGSTLTQDSGGSPGTPAYMSPEQALGKEVDLRSDLYSLGVMIYALVSGSEPFKGSSSMATLYMQVHDDATSLSSVAKTPVSQELVAIVHRCLEKAPGKRFQSARELREALAALNPSRGRSELIFEESIDTTPQPKRPSSVRVTAGVPRGPAAPIIAQRKLEAAPFPVFPLETAERLAVVSAPVHDRTSKKVWGLVGALLVVTSAALALAFDAMSDRATSARIEAPSVTLPALEKRGEPVEAPVARAAPPPPSPPAELPPTAAPSVASAPESAPSPGAQPKAVGASPSGGKAKLVAPAKPSGPAAVPSQEDRGRGLPAEPDGSQAPAESVLDLKI